MLNPFRPEDRLSCRTESHVDPITPVDALHDHQRRSTAIADLVWVSASTVRQGLFLESELHDKESKLVTCASKKIVKSRILYL